VIVVPPTNAIIGHPIKRIADLLLLQGRRALAAYDDSEDRLHLWSSTQLAHEVWAFLMSLLRHDENQLPMVAPDVGGGFGAKFLAPSRC
jgi:CO/xanthine dehydrogenase Mo-binding subunit